MGWAAYRVTRKNTESGETLGEMAVIFPKVSSVINLPKSSKDDYHLKMVDLITNPDFPVESAVFAPDGYTDKVKEYGFGNVINATTHIGETWYLDNGNYIRIEKIDTSSRVYIRFMRGGDDVLLYSGSTGVNNYRTWFDICFPPCLIGNNKEGGRTTPTYILSGSDSDTIYWSRGTEPTFPSPPNVYELNFFKGAKPIVESTDPYDDGGMSGEGGGTGNFDGTGDDISIPGIPTLSAVDAGFITLFNPTLGELHNLSSYMWSDLFDIDGWRKIFADPMNAILGMSIVPVSVPSGVAKIVKVGNISTGVSMTTAASQYVEVDCGTLNVNEYWGAYLDYDPYTKAEIYLPYIGTHPISTDDIMNKPVHVVYHVDILSGACCAYVQCGGSVLYSFIGQCASSIPITGDNWTNVINGAISIAGSIGSMVATGGASAPMAIGQIASTAVNAMKPSVEKSGAMGGTGGMLGVQTPYLILTRPRQALPKYQNMFTGYPSFITEDLNTLSGYTEIDSIHLESVPATEPELSEIESLLKSGVIF